MVDSSICGVYLYDWPLSCMCVVDNSICWVYLVFGIRITLVWSVLAWLTSNLLMLGVQMLVFIIGCDALLVLKYHCCTLTLS